MSLLTSGAGGILTPEEVGELVVRPVSRLSVAYQVSQVAVIGSHEFRIPILTADGTASFVAEGAEIPADDAEVSELVITPKKVAALSMISSELATDSINESATEVIGQSLARDTARAVDAAFFGTTTANGPSGLGALAGVSEVEWGTLTNLDAFAEGQSLAEEAGAVIIAWVTSPSTVLSLARLKRETGSNEPLLQPDPTLPGRRQVFGAPLLSSPAVGDGTVWGIPAAYATAPDDEDQSGRLSYVVQAQEASLDVDESVMFTSDRVAIRTKLRVAFGWPHPAAVVKIEHGGS
ncbi:phage major capsid protein [Mycolicibacterium neoaurum]|uniref:phage major capsid protein n=1 Tax=Mycolicibacterium neoaurum TaxID=1795 RepID=UPI001BCC1B5A|nr:phage major capsid protein [Mycolicibacterium neoaurum]QVI26170.1 phage major capsid protein [Mycolicibacterium neoaurum]